MKNLKQHNWIVIFDMDGVIFQSKNFWLELHQLYETQEDAFQLAEQLMKCDYRLMAKLTVEKLWVGKPAEPFWQLIRESQYQPGIKEVFKFLASSGIKTAIVSSGPLQLAQRAQNEIGINEIRANEIVFEGTTVGSIVNVNVDDNEKWRVGLEIIEKLNGTQAMTIFVGDSDPDASLSSIVGVSIAYNTDSEKLKSNSKYVLEYGQLPELIGIIKNEIASSPYAVKRNTGFL